MISTYLGYLQYSNNPVQSLVAKASDPTVSRESQYYKRNIDKVTSVSDLVNNYELFSYAMKSYGLEDMIYAKSFMTKVLESDLSDSNSFANKLSDSRYREFAAAFDFASDGSIANPADVQDDNQQTDTINLYTDKNTVPTETAYYKTYIGGVSSVDGLVNDSRLLNYALTAYGIDPTYISAAAVKQALTSDLSDPNSYANTVGGNFLALAKAFNFNTDGSVTSGQNVQSQSQIAATTSAYADASGYTSPISTETDYYTSTIVNVTSVDGFLNNDRLLNYGLTANDLNPDYMSKDTLRQVLTSDLSDPNSVANTLGGSYLALAQAFNFDTEGSIKAGDVVQSPDQLATTTGAYEHNADGSTSVDLLVNTSAYQTGMPKVKTVDDLLGNSQLNAFIRSAYGLDASTVSDATIKKALESDLSEPNSFVNTQGNSSLLALAKDFNFDANGNVSTKLSIQSSTSITATTTAYSNAVNATNSADTSAVTAETKYYNDTIGTVTSMDDLLANQRLVTYIEKAYRVANDNLTTDQLRQILTSDLSDKNSCVNQQKDTRYRTLAAAFNFNTDGTIARETAQQAQARSSVQATYNDYLEQSIETDAGDQNEGVRLALYFQRKAPTIKSAYSILADQALLQVVQTALGIPAASSMQDIDTQAKTITNRLNIGDLQDPDKVKKLIAQFAALYDMNNNTAANDGAVSLISGVVSANSGSAGISEISMDLLAGIQATQFGG